MKKLIYIISPIVLGAMFIVGLNAYIDHEITDLYKQKSVYPMLHDTKSIVKDKGIYANNHFLKNDYIFIMGSSELSHSTKQHPDYYFDTGRTKHGVVSIGRAYTQSLQHATILGSTDPDIKDKKVVLLLSMQWFMDESGVTQPRFLARFSPVQFYSYLDNPKISKELKDKFVKRVSYLLNERPGEYKPEALYASLYQKNTLGAKMVKMFLHPYYSFRKYMVSLKDKGITFSKLKWSKDKAEVDYDIKEVIDWKYERKKAIKDAKIRVGNNPEYLGGKRLFLDKVYYNTNIKGKDDFFKNKYANVNLLKSNEYGDLDIFLDTCKDLGIKPTIVLLPTNSDFYNYTGITDKKRDEYIKNIKSIIKPYGFNILDITNEAGEKYYLRDVMHLGTLGWVDLCEKIYNIYEK